MSQNVDRKPLSEFERLVASGGIRLGELNSAGGRDVFNKQTGEFLGTAPAAKTGMFSGLGEVFSDAGRFASDYAKTAGPATLMAAGMHYALPALAGGSAVAPAAAAEVGGAAGLSSGTGMTLGSGSGLTASGASLAPSLGGAAGSTLAAGGAGGAAALGGAGGASMMSGGSIFGTGLATKDLLPLGAQLLGASMGADAAKGAADTQTQSAREALGLQTRIYDESVARSKPFYDTSVQANSKLSRLLGFGGDAVDVMEEDPGYQFRKSEGMKAVDNSAAARGMSLSGGAMKAMQKYGQNYASNEFNNVYNRLSSTAGGGQVANNVNNLGTNFGNSASNLITDSGNAEAAGQVGSANSWSNGLQGVVNNYQQNQLMNLLTEREKKRGFA